MGKWFRRVKAMLGTGVLWSAGSLFVGALASPVLAALAGVGFSLVVVVETGLLFAAFGLVAGTGFAWILSGVEGRKTVEQLLAWRVALLGAVAGLAFPVLLALFPGVLAGAALPLLVPVSLLSVFLGAGLSAGTVLAAQNAKEELTAGHQAEARLTGLAE